MRHSMAWPLMTIDFAAGLSLSRSPEAMRIWRFHQIDAGDGFRDRVLHLDARVHLDEVELAVLVHEELDGAGVRVANVAQASQERSRRFRHASSA